MFRIVTLALIGLLCGCQSAKERYLISVYQSPEAEGEESADGFAQSRLGLRLNGDIPDQSLVLKKELVNSAQPSYTRDLPGGLITIQTFPDMSSLRSYLSRRDLNQQPWFREGANLVAQYTAKSFNPMGMMSRYPAIGQVEIEADDAFVMVNAIEMRSFWNPAVPLRIMRHMHFAMPVLEANDVEFLKPYAVIETLSGNFNMDVLFLTLWPSEEVFYSVHENPAFVEMAQLNRNKAFSNFTESKMTTVENEPAGNQP